jgi:hypothetical protein
MSPALRVRFSDHSRTHTAVVIALWIAVVATIITREAVMLSNPLPPGVPWRGAGIDRYFLDFRDTVWTPGRFLLEGGNPYDPDAYRAAYPWALSFSLYAPVWLLLAAALSPLPYLISIIVFQVLSLAVAVLMLHLLFRWSLPRHVAFAVPIALLWMNIWYPGRGALSVQLTTLLAVIGVTLVIRSVCAPSGRADADDRAGAWGVALCLLKPQFGTMAIVGLAAGRARSVAWGVAGLALASLPMLVVCTVAAGGPGAFVDSVIRDLAVANSNTHPSGLMYPDQRRLDLLGQIVRWGSGAPPAWLQIAVPIIFLVVVPVIVVRLTRRPLAQSAVVCTSMLIGIYHGTYDLLVLFVPVAIGIGMALRGELTRAGDRITLLACSLVVLHLQTVSTAIVPGLGILGADAINLLLLVVGLVAGIHTAITIRHDTPETGDRRTPSPTLSR